MDTCDTKSAVQDGSQQQTNAIEVPPIVVEDKQIQGVSAGGDTGAKKKKTRRGKSKRKANKPYAKVPWHQRRNPIGKNSKINRNRKLVLAQAKLHAPYNTNQFLMEVHMPESEGVFQIPRAPSARTRDSSFSVDSEENYFYSLPEDEEDFLTKEFSSVYEDAQSERLANMTKEQLMGENVILEAKVESLTKRLISRSSNTETEKEDKANVDCKISRIVDDLNLKLKEQEDLIRDLQASNDSLRLQNERLTQKCLSRSSSSSADSESDSSSSSSSSSSQGSFQVTVPVEGTSMTNGSVSLVNGFRHTPSPDCLVNGNIDSDEEVSDEEVILQNGDGAHDAEIFDNAAGINN